MLGRSNYLSIAFGPWVILSALFAQQPGITTGGASQRPIFVRGRVELADGQKLPQRATILLVCQGEAQPQGQTDNEGRFSLQLGVARFTSASDAAIGTRASGSGFGGALSGQSQMDGMSVMSLMGCTLRAELPGYVSDSADLSRVRLGDSPDVGVLVLRKAPQTTGSTVSATSLSAPRNARQALERARERLGRRQYVEAERELRTALKLYPQYAEAWFELGELLLQQKKGAEAREAFEQAIAADQRFARPYVSLARLAATERNWREAVEKAGAALKLNPYEFPEAYYYSAVAHYNLGSWEKALEEAQEAVKLDAAHRVPLAYQLIGVIHLERGNYEQAVESFQAYLRYAPPGANVEAARRLLAEAQSKLGR